MLRYSLSSIIEEPVSDFIVDPILANLQLKQHCQHCFVMTAQCGMLEEQLVLMQNQIDTLTNLVINSTALLSRSNSQASLELPFESTVHQSPHHHSQLGADFEQAYRELVLDIVTPPPTVAATATVPSDSVHFIDETDNCGPSQDCPGRTIGTECVRIENHISERIFYEDISDNEEQCDPINITPCAEETPETARSPSIEIDGPPLQLFSDNEEQYELCNFTASTEETPEAGCSPLIEVDGLPFELFSAEKLITSTRFSHSFKNREAAYYGEFPYSYGKTTHKACSVSENQYLKSICSYVEIVLPDFKFNSAMIHKYLDGTMHMPSHSDSEEEIVPGSNIVTISLGATRPIEFRNMKGSTVASVLLEHGKIITMSQASQSSFTHAIPPVDCPDVRVSITLRLIKPVPKNLPSFDSISMDCSSTASGYVPYTEAPPVHHRPKDRSSVGPASYSSKVRSQPPGRHYKPDNQATHAPSNTIFVSSSMFKYLNADKMSSKSQKAHVFSYSGATAAHMKDKLTRDNQFCNIKPETVGKIFLLCGTTNVDPIYYGSRTIDTAKNDITVFVEYLTNRFPKASVNVINLLPRINKGRNDIAKELNLHLQNLNKQQDRVVFVDTENNVNLFSNKGNRLEKFFRQDKEHPDNVHLNDEGIVRLARHLKHLAHKD